jgi:WD40-like Beta Propeller Repeat
MPCRCSGIESLSLSSRDQTLKRLAYTSDESGTFQIYVISFPGAGEKRQITTLGGTQPRWKEDGKELYYLALDGKVMAIAVRTGPGPAFEAGAPQELFDARIVVDPIRDQFAATADGQRFLIQRMVGEASSTPMTVALDWRMLLNK